MTGLLRISAMIASIYLAAVLETATAFVLPSGLQVCWLYVAAMAACWTCSPAEAAAWGAAIGLMADACAEGAFGLELMSVSAGVFLLGRLRQSWGVGSPAALCLLTIVLTAGLLTVTVLVRGAEDSIGLGMGQAYWIAGCSTLTGLVTAMGAVVFRSAGYLLWQSVVDPRTAGATGRWG